MTLSALVFAIGVLAVQACSDGHDSNDPAHAHTHAHTRRTAASITPPSRPLVWGDLNVLHTTDSHGWLLGHQKQSPPEPNYSGDFGDFASFVTHMKEIAMEKNVDLLLVDSGDVHDGTGLSDGYPPGEVDAHESNKFILKLPYDLLAIGNHELYVYNNTLDMYQNFAPHWNGRYLSSNVNITIPNQQNPGTNISVPVGNRFAKFTTMLGRRVTSLGVIFDFTGNDVGTTVQKVEDMVKEPWFLEAIEEEPDVFLLVGHMPVSQDNYEGPLVFNAIRAVHPATPILIFGGHTHIRDCVQYDGRSIAIESGRYMETIGMLDDVDLEESLKPGCESNNLSFSRRYLDANRVTYEFHTRLSEMSFSTLLGQQVTQGLNELAAEYDLSFTYGFTPQDYYLSRVPYPSNNSSLTLYISEAAPVALQVNNPRANIPAIFIINAGSQRFDIFAGVFNKNDQLTATSFADKFLYIADVPLGVAKEVLPALNGNSSTPIKRAYNGAAEDEILYGQGDVRKRYNRWLKEMNLRWNLLGKRSNENGDLTLGYVTEDSCPGIGDDTLHIALPYFDSPDYIASDTPAVSDDTPIDLVFVDFIENRVLTILNELQTVKNYTTSDVGLYSPLLSNQVLGVYAQEKWN